MAHEEPILRKILFFFFILQKRRATEHKRELRRLNPYNPLSYIFIAILFAVATFVYGIIVAWKEIGKENHFKWQ
jgi:hypothetical protein